jgi:carbamoyltransferase
MAASGVLVGMSWGHNTTACILVDGKLVACASQERFDRVKNSRAFPLDAIRYVIAEAGAKIDDVDEFQYTAQNGIGGLARTFDEGSPAMRMLHRGRQLGDAFADRMPGPGDLYVRARRLLAAGVQPRFRQQFREETARTLGIDAGRVHLNNHHSCHAWSGYAFYAGQRDWHDPALILTLDAEGDDLCATVSVGREGRIQRLASTPAGRSIGVLYAAITRWLGMKAEEHEYKVMGLAPYAPARMAESAAELLGSLVRVEGLDWRTSCNSDRFYDVLQRLLRGQRFDAVAGGVQLLLERLVTEWVREAIARTGISDLVLSGGVFMNVKANKVILELPEVSSVTVCPSAGDESTPIGAVFAAHLRRVGGRWNPEPLVDNLYLGPSFSDAEIDAALSLHHPKQPYDVVPLHPEDEAETIASLLVQGEVVARFAGRMEFGARALGNRSILADPSRRELVRVINDQIKGRDFWMPFACTLAEPGSERYIVNPKHALAPYMALAFDTVPQVREAVVAGIHPYDWTMRPQVVSADDNPRYHAIVRAFEARTGIGAVLNTSFNLHGEPVVCSPTDALHVFDESGLRNLQLEHVLLRKRG